MGWSATDAYYEPRISDIRRSAPCSPSQGTKRMGKKLTLIVGFFVLSWTCACSNGRTTTQPAEAHNLALGSSAPPTIFGIKLGEPLDQFPKCKKTVIEKENACWWQDKDLARQPAHQGEYFFAHLPGAEKAQFVLGTELDGRIQDVIAMFKQDDADDVVDALQAKFGASPSTSEGHATTHLGIAIKITNLLWTCKDGSMVLFRSPYTKLGRCMVEIVTPAWIEHKKGKKPEMEF
jgi:hypothetical protein